MYDPPPDFLASYSRRHKDAQGRNRGAGARQGSEFPMPTKPGDIVLAAGIAARHFFVGTNNWFQNSPTGLQEIPDARIRTDAPSYKCRQTFKDSGR